MEDKNSSFSTYLFCIKYWPGLALLLFGVFLIFVRSTGSLDGDEAIYAQVARETLAQDSWLTLYWRGDVWLEKSPFFICSK